MTEKELQELQRGRTNYLRSIRATRSIYSYAKEVLIGNKDNVSLYGKLTRGFINE